MKIGELATLADCPVQTIRYYEREGLLPPPARSDGNYRLYSPEHSERLTFIRNCRSLDMTLNEIRGLLNLRDRPQEDCASVNQLIDAHIQHVQARVASLQALQEQLLELRQRCAAAQEVEHCPILQQLQALSLSAAGATCPSSRPCSPATNRPASGCRPAKSELTAMPEPMARRISTIVSSGRMARAVPASCSRPASASV